MVPHRTIDQQGTTYILEQLPKDDDGYFGDLILRSESDSLSCQGKSQAKDMSVVSTGFVYGGASVAPITAVSGGGYALSSNLRCNDSTITRCEGTLSEEGHFGGACKHPVRGPIYVDGVVTPE